MMISHRLAALAIATGLVVALEVPAAGQTAPGRDARNAALRYWMAFALLQDPPADTATTALLERVSSGQAPWDEARLGPILDANQGAIETLRRGANLQACDWGVEYDLGPRAPVAHLAKARVLGRLAALSGLRLSDNRQSAEAVETWLAGVRFAEHVAQGGSLISLLTARAALVANLRALTQAANATRLDEQQVRRITALVQVLPVAAFDWGAAIEREQGALSEAVRQLSSVPDPSVAYRDMMGVSPPAGFTVPSATQMEAYRRFMNSVAETFRLAPGAARQRLPGHEQVRSTLPMFLRDTTPSLDRINDVHIEVAAERQKLLDTLRAPRR